MEPLQQVQKDIEAVQDEISKVNSLLEQATERADIQYYREKEKQLRTKEEQLRAKELLLLQPAGASSSSLHLMWLLAGMHFTLGDELLERPVPGLCIDLLCLGLLLYHPCWPKKQGTR